MVDLHPISCSFADECLLVGIQANVVSEIASSDWPDEWPNLLDSLVGLLGSGGADSVHGAMRVLTDFVSSDLSEDQLLPLANTILPQLLQVLGDEQVCFTFCFAGASLADIDLIKRHSAVTRAQAVSVFNQCLTTLYMVKESHPQAATYASTQVLPQWIQAFQHLLSVDPAATGRWDSLYVINEIFQVLSTTLVSFPKTLNDSLESLLLNAVRLLTSLTVPFRATHLNDELDSDFSLDAEDSSPLSLPVIASNIFLFITSASKRASARAAFIQPEGKQPTDLFRQLIYLAFFFARVTSEDAETWSTDVNAFVADEDDELPAATVRTASLDLVSAFAMSHKQATLSVLPQAVQKSVQEAERMQAEARADWWKAVESSLVHLASLADDLEDTDFTAATGGLDDHFNLQAVFQKLVVPYLERLGRCTYFQRSRQTSDIDDARPAVPARESDYLCEPVREATTRKHPTTVLPGRAASIREPVHGPRHEDICFARSQKAGSTFSAGFAS